MFIKGTNLCTVTFKLRKCTFESDLVVNIWKSEKESIINQRYVSKIDTVDFIKVIPSNQKNNQKNNFYYVIILRVTVAGNIK